MKTLTALALALLALTASAQSTQRLTAARGNDYAVTYSLPKTAVDISLTAEITETTPGEFYNYARRYLGITDAVTAPSRQVRVTGAGISSHGIADPDNRWQVQFKPGSNPFIILTPEGIPLAINSEVEIPENPAPTSAMTLTSGEDPESMALAARQAVTAEMARSSSVPKRAELAAQRIFELREMRSDLLSGQADNMPADGAALQLALQMLENQENALIAMFAGTHRTYTATATATVVPDSTSVDAPAAVLARINPLTGFTTPDDLGGAPVSWQIRLVESAELPVDERGAPRTFPRGGVAYALPGIAEITVLYDGTPVASRQLPVAQLGDVFGLNPALFSDKREPSAAIFDPATGALLQLAPMQQ